VTRDNIGEGLASADMRKQMCREMVRIRLVEEEIVTRYPQGEMRCPTHICIGQEAPPVGVSAHLKQSDAVFSAHRSHGHYLAKGADLKAMIAELYGRSTGCARGKGGSQHLVDLDAGFMGSAPILASTISVGVGMAWSFSRAGNDQICVIYFGDGATEEGAFHEAMNYAGVHKLPVVFVCENNLYSVHTPLEVRQPARTIAALAEAHGVNGLSGDGNDVDEVWRLADKAVNTARSGRGPSLLEFATYRIKEHVGPNEDGMLGYRSQTEIDTWQSRCPVARYAKALIDEGLISETETAQWRSEIAEEIDQAFQFAIASEFPTVAEQGQFVNPEQTGSSQ